MYRVYRILYLGRYVSCECSGRWWAHDKCTLLLLLLYLIRPVLLQIIGSGGKGGGGSRSHYSSVVLWGTHLVQLNDYNLLTHALWLAVNDCNPLTHALWLVRLFLGRVLGSATCSWSLRFYSAFYVTDPGMTNCVEMSVVLISLWSNRCGTDVSVCVVWCKQPPGHPKI